MSEKNKGERRSMSGVNTISFILCVLICLYTAVHKILHTEQHLPLDFFELLNIEALVPAHVNEHLDAAIELEKRLRCWRRRLRTEQGCEVEHGEGSQLH